MKKFLSLILTLALLSTVFGTVAMAESVKFTTTTLEKLRVVESADGQKVTDYSESTSNFKIASGATSETVYNNWFYYKYDISGISDISEVTAVTLGLYARFNKTGKFYLYALDESVWTAAKAAAGTTVAAGTFANPHKETDKELLDRVGMNYQNTTYQFKLTGEAYTDSTSFAKTATYAGGSLKTYIDNAVKADQDYIYISVCFAANSTTNNNDTEKNYGNVYLTESATANCLTIEGENTPAYTDFSNAEIAWDNGTCTISNVPATGTAMLIAASFNGTTMVDAQVATIDAANDVENGVITETFTGLADGTVKLFLWDSSTLAPAINVTTP